MRNDRLHKFALNTTSSITLQFASVICGFVLPRLILNAYGSEVNGLVNSVSEFLGVISLCEFGVGAVVESALYKPLANKNSILVSKIYVSAQKFFKKIAYILLGYVFVLCILYPHLVKGNYDYIYIVTLIIAISISYFAQYYFGIVDGIVLSADQHGYIQYNAQTITVILNTIACSLLIKAGASIQIVKFITSVIYLFRPLFFVWYVGKNYKIDKNIYYDEEPIRQKWNGVAQHICYFVLNRTDTIVLTIFSTLSNVSIYAVYNLIQQGIKMIITSVTSGFQPLIGNMLANKEMDKLKNFFSFTEWYIHTITTLVYGCTGILIVNFIMVYTSGITDANYNQPLFASIITFANAWPCLRIPYFILISAAGEYKETQKSFIIAMLLNIVISVVMVFEFGLVGVAIGTLIAMAYHTIYMAWYDSKHIIYYSFNNFIKQILVDISIVIIASVITFRIPLSTTSYIAWLILAIKVFIIWLIVSLTINFILNRNKLSILSNYAKNKIKSR